MSCYLSPVARTPRTIPFAARVRRSVPNFPPLLRLPALCLRPLALAALLAVAGPRAVRGESAIAYKHENYRESGGRVTVKTDGATVHHDFDPLTQLKVEGIVDAIAGATPNGQPAPAGSDRVPLVRLTERRKAWAASLTRQFPAVKLALGAANSRESDYVSTGGSLNGTFDFNRKNTALLAGAAATTDDVKVFHRTEREKKRTSDLIVGVTQLLDPRTSVTVNVTWGRQRGYLSDPYKLVQKTTEIVPGLSLPLTFPENRPGERDKFIVLTAVNRAFPAARGALEAVYRFYHDSFGTDAHTLELAWFQRFGERLIVKPSLRLYDQSAADFYRYRLDGTPIVPVAGGPRPAGPFYSSDYRLSAMQTHTVGLKAVWEATAHVHLDAAYERYGMRGTDGVTSRSAYPRAGIWTAGMKVLW